MPNFALAQIYAKRARAAKGSPRYKGLCEQADLYIQALESADEQELLNSLMDEVTQDPLEDFSYKDLSQIKSSQPDGKRKAKLRLDFLQLIDKQFNLVQLYNTLYDFEMTLEPDFQAILDQYTQIEEFCDQYTFELREQLDSVDLSQTNEGHRYALSLQLLRVALSLICEHSAESASRNLAGFNTQPMSLSLQNVYFLVRLFLQSPVTEPMPEYDLIETLNTLEAIRKNAPALIEFLTRSIELHPAEYRKEFADIFKFVHALSIDACEERLDALVALELYFHPNYNALTTELVVALLETNPVFFYSRYASERYAQHHAQCFLKLAAKAFGEQLKAAPVKVAHDLFKCVIALPSIDGLPYDIYPTLELLEDFHLYACTMTSSKQEEYSAVVSFVYNALNHTKLVDEKFSTDSAFVTGIMEEYHRLHGSRYSLINVSPGSSEDNLETIDKTTGETPRQRFLSLKKTPKV